MTDSKKKKWMCLLQKVLRLSPGSVKRLTTGFLGPGFIAACFLVMPAAAANIASSLNTPSIDQSLSGNAGTPVPAEAAPAPAHAFKQANFKQESPSAAVQELADWVVDSANNRTLPFMIIDKVQAKAFAFDARGELRGAAPVLLGLAVGDDSVPGIGERKLSSIRPDERTTPAGRFVASLAKNLRGEEMLWVDYDTSISLHRVVTSLPKERRAERLSTPSPLDNRISYGCINVPVKFYDEVVSPAFTGTDGIVYILPETRSAREVFGSYDIRTHAGVQTASQTLNPPPVHFAPGK